MIYNYDARIITVDRDECKEVFGETDPTQGYSDEMVQNLRTQAMTEVEIQEGS
jgi:hypothetical protein